jgi:sulfite oxidase
VDSFWQQWAYHHLSPKVVEALELLRIGALTDWTADDDCLDDGGQYTDEPHASRGMGQDVLFPQPFCSQSTPETLGSSYLTPNDDFYVRNHAPVPVTLPADLHEYELTFNRSPRAGNGPTTEVLRAPLEFICGLFPAVTVTSIVQCTGNRAAEAIAAHPDKESGFKETPFEDIGFGMLGNAQWSGARLSEVLSALYPGLATEDHTNLHVAFGGEDGYSCSVPLATVMDPTRDCILATRMNGKPLPLDHGYPVRALLPGVVGARNVKWVSSITIQNSECDSPWQALYYKVGPENEKVSAHHLPLQALTTSPPQGSAAPTPGAPLAANGVAFSGGSGNRIRAVQLSLDGGANWVDAEVHRAEVLADSSSRAYGWVRWSATLQTPAGGAAALVCRAVDDEGNASPAVGVPGGYLYDGYQTVRFAPGPAVDMPEAAEALQDAAQ